MGEFLGDKPSSRVLRPPGGGASNIFGGSDDQSSGKRLNTKPTFQSSVFNTDPDPAKPRPTSGTRPGDKCSDIFGAGTDNNNKPTSPEPKKISKTHQSTVFKDPEPMSEERRKAPAIRSDPITGPSQEIATKVAAPIQVTPPFAASTLKENGQSKRTSNDSMKDHNPHLGPIKNDSGVRCAQPPGGKSSLSLF